MKGHNKEEKKAKHSKTDANFGKMQEKSIKENAWTHQETNQFFPQQQMAFYPMINPAIDSFGQHVYQWQFYYGLNGNMQHPYVMHPYQVNQSMNLPAQNENQMQENEIDQLILNTIPELSGQEEKIGILKFFKKFTLISDEWPEEKKIMALESKLVGKAEKAFYVAIECEPYNYQSIRRSILNQLGCEQSCEVHRPKEHQKQQMKTNPEKKNNCQTLENKPKIEKIEVQEKNFKSCEKKPEQEKVKIITGPPPGFEIVPPPGFERIAPLLEEKNQMGIIQGKATLSEDYGLFQLNELPKEKQEEYLEKESFEIKELEKEKRNEELELFCESSVENNEDFPDFVNSLNGPGQDSHLLVVPTDPVAYAEFGITSKSKKEIYMEKAEQEVCHQGRLKRKKVKKDLEWKNFKRKKNEGILGKVLKERKKGKKELKKVEAFRSKAMEDKCAPKFELTPVAMDRKLVQGLIKEKKMLEEKERENQGTIFKGAQGMDECGWKAKNEREKEGQRKILKRVLEIKIEFDWKKRKKRTEWKGRISSRSRLSN